MSTRSTFIQQTEFGQLFNVIRNHLNDHEFNEIETPFLKPTPEGARDYIVPVEFTGSFCTTITTII